MKVEHAAIRVMDHDDLARAEQLLGDDQRAEGVTGEAPGIADDVRIAFLEAKRPRGNESGVHAGDDRDLPRGRQRQFALGEAGGIAGVRGNEFFGDRHVRPPRRTRSRSPRGWTWWWPPPRAWSRSAMRSLMFSRRTERRTSSGATVAFC